MNTTLEMPAARPETHLSQVTAQPGMHAQTPIPPSMEHLMKIGLGFWASKTLLSAAELGVFTELAKGPLDAESLRQRLGLHPRSTRDFFDALVALRLLDRVDGQYFNTPETDYYLDRNKPSYAGGGLEMCNARLFGFWNSLTEGLRTGAPQNEIKTGGDLFGNLYQTPEKLETFLKSMTSLSLGAAKAMTRQFPWKYFQTYADIGVAQGVVPAQISQAHPHLTGIGYDLPVVQPIFERYMQEQGVADRVRFQAGDFFRDPLPKVDVIIMGHILHDWDLTQKKMLIRKAYNALPEGGAFIVYEALIDDERRENAFGLLMSLNMLLETPGGFDYTGADCQRWMREAGFRATRVEHLEGPDSMVVGIK